MTAVIFFAGFVAGGIIALIIVAMVGAAREIDELMRDRNEQLQLHRTP